MEKRKVYHEFSAFYQEDSKILILGSMPSVESRKQGFYYMHPRNRFWSVLEEIFSVKLDTLDEKKEFLKEKKIALWDVIESCMISSSSDSSISDVIVNDISSLLSKTNIQTIYTTGKKAYQLYQKYCYPTTLIHAKILPSTSPANAQISFSKLVESYSILRKEESL